MIEEQLKEIPGVKRVSVNHKNGRAEVEYDGAQPAAEVIAKAVDKAGYEVGETEKPTWFSKNRDDYRYLGYAALIIFVLYLVGRSTGIFELNLNTDSTSLWIIPLVGLVAGFSTCMAIIGGLVLGVSARYSEVHPEATSKQKFVPHLFFNLGRIGGFALLGGLMGLIGSALKPSAGFLGIMTIVVGLVMILLGLKLIEIFPKLKNKTIALPKSLGRLLGANKGGDKYSHRAAAVSGVLTFFLPCGFTQAMQLLAVSSGSFATGALIMFLFAIGTAPGLLGVGGLASIFKGKKAKVFYATAGLLIIILGSVNIANGSKLISFKGGNNNVVVDQPTGDEQVIRMTQKANGYYPTNLVVENGRPVKWVITSETSFSCAAYLVVPEYRISTALKKGENIIRFTPTRAGTVPFSCSMGMYRGQFTVVEKNSGASADSASVATTPTGGEVVCRFDTGCGPTK